MTNKKMTAEANSTLYILHSTLFVEVLLEGGELVLFQDAALPPCCDEAEAIAH